MKTKVIDCPELEWSFRGSFNPTIAVARELLDPFPCYAHDIEIIEEMLSHLETCVDIEVAPKAIYVLHHETQARTNGVAFDATTWNEDREHWDISPGTIVLPGKRIPPMPAMTRYVVAHEYGHHVEYEMCRIADVGAGGLDGDYARMRNLPEGWSDMGARKWHTNVGEVMANDFRILIADVEPEFWPHPHIAHPRDTQDSALRDWWVDHLDEHLLTFVQSSR